MSVAIEGVVRVDLSRKWRWLEYRGCDIEYDECGRNMDIGENFDDQDKIFLLEDGSRQWRVCIV